MEKIIIIIIATLFINIPFSYGKKFFIISPSDSTLQPGMSFSSKVIKELYKRLNIKIKLTSVHATRSLIMANSGKADAELVRTKIIENKFKNLKRVNFPIDKISFRALSLNPDINDVKISELIEKRIAYKRGFVVLEKIFKNNKRANRLTSSEQIFRMVLNKRIDFGIVLTRTFGKYIMKPEFKKIRIIKTNIPNINLYHYINRKHEKLAPKMIDTLKKMKEDKFF